MRTEIINLIKCLTTKGQPGLDDHLVELVERYEKMKAMSEGISSEITAEDKDIMFAEEILNIFYSGKELGSQEVVLDEEKPESKGPELKQLREVLPDMKAGDIFEFENEELKSVELSKDKNQIWIIESDILKSSCASYKHYMGKVQIIPADPKVLKFLEWMEQEDYYNPIEKNEYSLEDMKISFEAGTKNGRLERDLEVKPVIEKVKRYMELPSCNDLSMVMNHLKPLNPNE